MAGADLVWENSTAGWLAGKPNEQRLTQMDPMCPTDINGEYGMAKFCNGLSVQSIKMGRHLKTDAKSGWQQMSGASIVIDKLTCIHHF